MKYMVVENDGLYDVTLDGMVIESFYSVTDAQDYVASLIWERDNAFADIGCEFDQPWLD